jgi:hypothetical protein
VSRYPSPSWRDEERSRTITGHFRKGVHERSYYIELEGSGLRWDVLPKPAHMKLLGKRVCATGRRSGYKLLNLSEITLAE